MSKDRIKLGAIRPQITDAPAAPKKPLRGKPGAAGEQGVGWEVQYSELGVDPWHSPPATVDDAFRRERLTGATEWGPATLIVGTPGADGAGQFVAVVYKASATEPSAPSGSYVPTGWSAEPVDTGEDKTIKLWASRGICNADNSISGSWGTPHLYIFRAEYLKAEMEISSPIITGGVVQTNSSGTRIEMRDGVTVASSGELSAIRVFNSDNTVLGGMYGQDKVALHLETNDGLAYLTLSPSGPLGSVAGVRGDKVHLLGVVVAKKFVKRGSITFPTPSTSVFNSYTYTFPEAFAGIPTVIATIDGTENMTTKFCSVSAVSASAFTLNYRTTVSSESTTVHWIAVYEGS